MTHCKECGTIYGEKCKCPTSSISAEFTGCALKVRDLHYEHPLVKAAKAMGKAYHKHPTMFPAMVEVRRKHPAPTEEQLILLWLGCNAIVNPE